MPSRRSATLIRQPSLYAGLGEIEEAVRWYQKVYDDRSPDMVFMQAGGRLKAALATNAGFRAIMEKMAFPPSAK
jgi:hypothetical protein